jgi:small nuclear ribonucleoprotein D3
MNVRLDDVNITSRDGKLYNLDQVYLRGGQIRFIIIPDMLKNAPMFKKIKNQTKAAKQAMIARGKVRGRGAQASASRGRQIVASVNL